MFNSLLYGGNSKKYILGLNQDEGTIEDHDQHLHKKVLQGVVLGTIGKRDHFERVKYR
jgi:hypothetical protein